MFYVWPHLHCSSSLDVLLTLLLLLLLPWLPSLMLLLGCLRLGI
jgi:hypothetical protein